MTWTAKDLDDLTTDVFAVLRDSERVFVTATQVASWINEAYLDICARLGYPEATATGTTSATGTIALPADTVEIKRLYCLNSDGEDEKLTWVDSDVFLSYSETGATAVTSIYRIWDDTIETLPVFASAAYTLEYIKQPTNLTASDTATELPPEMHNRLVRYAQAMAKLQEGELEESDRLMQMYERGLPDAPRGRWRKVAGPITLIPTPNISDGQWVN